jgi:hypothetical protein
MELEIWCPFGLPNTLTCYCTRSWKWWLGAESDGKCPVFEENINCFPNYFKGFPLIHLIYLYASY